MRVSAARLVLDACAVARASVAMGPQALSETNCMLPREYAPFIFGVIQSGLTTAVATGIATLSALGFNALAVGAWLVTWLIAWATMLPIVVVAAPFIQRAVLKLTAPPAP